jgi:hypothetical protein
MRQARTWVLLAVLVAAFSFGLAGPIAAQSPSPARANEILSALSSIEQKALWPGFDMAQIPVAIYDGHDTYLFRHPAPPPEFRPVAGTPRLLVCAGQYPAVRANTSTKIGDVATATLLAAGSAAPSAMAAIVAHEAFHVFQAQTHPEWVTNEMNLFTYPSEDAVNLALARIEAASLARALASSEPADAACWTRAALISRAERFGRLPAEGVAYERGVELVEGTASLVQYRTGDRSQPALSPEAFAADQTRQRAYASGRTLGLLLDRFAPGWDAKLQAATSPLVLETELASALPTAGANACGLPEDERKTHQAAAAEATAALGARRQEAARSFDTAAGWRLIVRATPDAPLGPQGFDPMNVLRLEGTRVLHKRWLKAGRGGGAIEILNRGAATRAAGDHPLFSGFREVEVTGLTSEPVVESKEDGSVTVQADGVHAGFPRAEVARTGQTITITVSK